MASMQQGLQRHPDPARSSARRALTIVARVAVAAMVVVSGALLAPAPRASALFNGDATTIGQYPFFANQGGLCGAAILNPEWAVTAAHCDAFRVGGRLYIDPGDSRGDVRFTQIREIVLPPSRAGQAWDVALLHIDPVPGAEPLPIATSLSQTDVVRNIASGSGSLVGPTTAQFRVDQIVDWTSGYASAYFMALPLKPAAYTCGGDSGSPAVTETGGRTQLVGIADRASCLAGSRTWFVNLTHPDIRSWITSTALVAPAVGIRQAPALVASGEPVTAALTWAGMNTATPLFIGALLGPLPAGPDGGCSNLNWAGTTGPTDTITLAGDTGTATLPVPPPTTPGCYSWDGVLLSTSTTPGLAVSAGTYTYQVRAG